MLKHDAMFFFAALFFIFLLWLATGGPTHPISWAGPFLNPPAPLGSGTAYFLSGAGFQVGGTGTGLAGFTIGTGNTAHLSNGGSSGGSSAIIANPSSYRGEVYIDTSPSGPEQQLAAAETITIDASSNASGPIDITGWRLVSANTNAPIPQGALVPVSGSVNGTSDIILNPGDQAIIGSGYSPIGVSFRENECTGYLDQYQSFTPRLDDQCPSIRNAYEDAYGGNDVDSNVQECEDFLGTIGRCGSVTQFPSDQYGNQEVSNSCQAYVNQHATYNGCVADYRSDPGFAGDVWRIYLSSRAGLWGDNHDTISLLDAGGKTVDVFSY